MLALPPYFFVPVSVACEEYDRPHFVHATNERVDNPSTEGLQRHVGGTGLYASSRWQAQTSLRECGAGVSAENTRPVWSLWTGVDRKEPEAIASVLRTERSGISLSTTNYLL